MAWSFVPRLPRWQAEEEEPSADAVTFPAGVVALGRGGAGEVGALLREDGVYVGLLSLGGRAGRGIDDLAALAQSLPGGACQIVTIRWPIDGERAATGWRAATRGNGGAALASAIAEGYLPALVEAGWSDVRTFLAIRRPDPETLLRDLATLAEALPVPARPATLLEAKRLAGDWFAPHEAGLVTIGWSVTELTAEPHPDWARTLLEEGALRGVPTTLCLHLDPVGAPAPVSIAVHRRVVALDAEIEARQEAAYRDESSDNAADGDHDELDHLLAERRELVALLTAGTGDSRPRAARLLLGCAVEPRAARALRGAVEAALQRIGFRAASFGPGRSDDTLLSCAPLGLALVGHDLTLTAHGAALLAPLAPTIGAAGESPERQIEGLPLGLRRDGAAVRLGVGEDMAIVGDAAAGTLAMAQTWVLGHLACGAQVTIVDSSGRWSNLALATGGERVQVALGVGGLLAGLGAERLHRAGGGTATTAPWVDLVAKLLCDLCPDLTEDDLGDLTAYLLTLAEGELAWGEPVQLGPIVARLRESDNEAVRHLAAMLTATGALRPRPSVGVGQPLTIFDAAPDHAGQRLVPPAGCAAVALQAALDHLAAPVSGGAGRRIVVLDDLGGLLEARSGPALVDEIVARARHAGIALWSVAESLAACPRPALASLRALDPAAVIFPGRPEAVRATARALGLRPGLCDGRVLPTGGEALVVRGEEATMIATLPLQLPPYTMRR